MPNMMEARDAGPARLQDRARLKDNRAAARPPTTMSTLPDDPTPDAAEAAAPAPIETDTARDVAAEATPEPTPAAKPEAAPEMGPAACGARLAELFPALFAPVTPPQPVKPIKLRIQADLQQRAPGVFSRRVLGIFFSRYTTSNAYLKALVNAPHRFDLDGQPAGEIAEEHRSAAAEELARRQAIAAERRATQRPPRRDIAPPQGDTAQRPPPAARTPRPPRDAQRRGERDTGAPLAARPTRPHPPQRPARAHERPQRPPGRPAGSAPPAAAAEPAAMPADPAQRERALLLRSFETSTLSKANFCALKGLSEATLDAALEQARQERAARQRH
jgi:ProP effector